MKKYGAKEGYDTVARDYPGWYWTEFWRMYEAPVVRQWLTTRSGRGLDLGGGFGPYDSPACAPMIRLDQSRPMLLLRQDAALKVQADIRALPFLDAKFSWLLTTRVLSHIPKPEQVFSEAARSSRGRAQWLVTDVHPQHPYDEMALRTGGTKVAIETFKHDLDSLVASAANAGFALLERREWRVGDLTPRPDPGVFAKLFTAPDTPVFYTLLLERTTP
jgi:hypothetical protein